jgi:SAM-dependent methyltransferase
VNAHDAGEYGRHIGSDYDDVYDGVFDTEGAVARLVELAQGGPVLEMGVGTGRLALPLAAAGLHVHGIDGSAVMLERLADKPGGRDVPTTLGDFSQVTVPGTFALAALTFNTIFALPDQDAQVRCFANVARHLRPGGRFVVEAWVPDPSLSAGSSLKPRKLASGYVGLVIADHDPSRQILATTQVVLGGEVGVRVYPVVHRYAHPSELDLMARLADMRLEHRWADWRGTPFSAGSADHVSVYRLGGGSVPRDPAG